MPTYTNTASKLGFGTLFGLSDNGSPPTFTTVAEVTSISAPALKRDRVDASFMESAAAAREFIYNLLDAGEITLELNFIPLDPTQVDLETQLTTPAATFRTYRIAWPDMSAQALTATESGNVWTTSGNHNFNTPQPVSFSTTGTLPAPLVPGAYYVARYASADTFTLFNNSADAVANTNEITLTGGSGTHTVHSGTVWTFEALVTGIEPTAKIDDKLAANITFQITGLPTIGV